MNILYHEGKGEPDFIAADTPEQRAAAFIWLFNSLDDEEYYCDLDNERDSSVSLDTWRHEKNLLEKARKGNSTAAILLLTRRKDGEYEFWYETELIEPLEGAQQPETAEAVSD